MLDVATGAEKKIKKSYIGLLFVALAFLCFKHFQVHLPSFVKRIEREAKYSKNKMIKIG